MSEIYQIHVRTAGAFGISESEAAQPYFLQGPDFSAAFKLIEKIYTDIGVLMERANVRFSKGFEKKVAGCSSEILVDMDSKLKLLKSTTREFYEFSKFVQAGLSDIVKRMKAGQDVSDYAQMFFKEFLRQLENLILGYVDRQQAFSLDTFHAHRGQLHERRLDAKYLKIVEGFYADFQILAQGLDSFFRRKVGRSFSKTDKGVHVDFISLLRDFDDIIKALATVIVEVQQASKA